MIHNSLKWYQTLGKDLAAKDKTKEHVSLLVAVIFIMTQSKKTLRKRRLFCMLWSGLGIFFDVVGGGNILVNTKTG
jgi:hypothetical protein